MELVSWIMEGTCMNMFGGGTKIVHTRHKAF